MLVSSSCPSGSTHGISSGRTSARILIESVLALEVGAAASRILSRAIWETEKQETHPCLSHSVKQWLFLTSLDQ